ncbi:hypothetical protein [Sedimentimonas flavescens]|uniref:hypothetical protein n=1 Tax=Sedimentimonas flavescens TaxID=2851012 RepID=UPI0021A3524B|nr:hypothetical protein [Sedimentimonas flavescens]MCT2539966.1 hypothetical protein [Sedimentimonas flavescens]
MPTLENDRLVFRFPHIENNARFSIDFQRTLRIPDSERTYSLPPGFGPFPLRHVDDYPKRLSATTTARGGIILPMWQAEALWLNFRNQGPGYSLDFPVAIKVAAGKINAVTGEPWSPRLHREPQDYLVSPEQPWLDGFAVSRGVIRQFVAMPLGDGYSVEEQLTGEDTWGGLQISVTPLKASVWHQKRRKWEEARSRIVSSDLCLDVPPSVSACAAPLGLGAGGLMRQEISADPFNLDDWDTEATDRVFITLLHAKDWKTVTGEAAPNAPPTARDYSRAGLPWFEYYGKDQQVLPGSTKLSGVESVGNAFKDKTGATLVESEDLEQGAPKAIGPGANSARSVRTNKGLWD